MDYNDINVQRQDGLEIKKAKSRNLSILDFYRILQLEAIVAELRTKIYPKTKDKNYWKKVYENKKKTIFDIANRNKVNNTPLPSIFTDEGMMSDFKNEIFGDGGFPKFIYKDDEQARSQGYLDYIYYYAKNADVACNHFGEVKMGKIKEYKAESKNITVVIDGETIETHINMVTRLI